MAEGNIKKEVRQKVDKQIKGAVQYKDPVQRWAENTGNFIKEMWGYVCDLFSDSSEQMRDVSGEMEQTVGNIDQQMTAVIQSTEQELDKGFAALKVLKERDKVNPLKNVIDKYTGAIDQINYYEKYLGDFGSATGITSLSDVGSAVSAAGPEGALVGAVLSSAQIEMERRYSKFKIAAGIFSTIFSTMDEEEQKKYKIGEQFNEDFYNYQASNFNAAATGMMAADLQVVNSQLASGNLGGEEQSVLAYKQKLEKWFIDNYGTFITAEEQKNGIRQETLDLIKEQNEAEEKNRRLALEYQLMDSQEEVEEIGEDTLRRKAQNEAYLGENNNIASTRNELLKLKTTWDAFMASSPAEDAKEQRLEKIKQKLKEINPEYREFNPEYYNVSNLNSDNVSEELENYAKSLQNDLIENENLMRENQPYIDAGTASLQAYYDVAQAIGNINLDGHFDTYVQALSKISDAQKTINDGGEVSTEDVQNILDTIPEFEGKADSPEVLGEAFGFLAEKLGGAGIGVDALLLSLGKIPPKTETTVVVTYTAGPSPTPQPAPAATPDPAPHPGPSPKPYAKWTWRAEPGLSVVNEEGPELIAGQDGSFRIASGSPALTYLSRGDRVYTARQTRAMLDVGRRLPAFASGTSELYRNTMADINHRLRTEDLSDEWELETLKNALILFTAEGDEAAVRELEESIYSLQKTIDRDLLQEILQSRSEAEEDDRRWNSRQFELGNISQADLLYAAQNRALRARNDAEAVWYNPLMSEEEMQKYYRQYIQEAEDAEMEAYRLQKEMARERAAEADEASAAYIKDRAYFGDWDAFGDDPISAYIRVRERKKEELEQSVIDEKEYAQQMREIGDALYEGRLADSDKWLETQRFYNTISNEAYIEGLQRIREYTQEYYDNGIITYQQYLEGIADVDKRIYTERVNACRELISAKEEEKRQIEDNTNTRISELEKEYNKERELERKRDREADLEELRKQEKLYQNAQTEQGKQRLEQIRDEIERLNEEAYEEQRSAELEKEKERLLAEKDRKIEELEAEIERIPAAYGLQVDEQGNYSKAANYDAALQSLKTFASEGQQDVAQFSQAVTGALDMSSKQLGTSLLTSFGLFSSNLSAMAEQIMGTMGVINGLEGFFGPGSSIDNRTSTNIVVNDYGNKNINAPTTGFDYWDTSRLLAKGVKV